jgi:nicotinamide-nucleotide amidase
MKLTVFPEFGISEKAMGGFSLFFRKGKTKSPRCFIFDVVKEITMSDLDVQLEERTKQVFDALTIRKLTLAIAESATGGLASNLITNIPGASKVFIGSVVCYTAQAKNMLLDVDWETINDYGTVSQEVSEALLNGLMKVGPDLRIAITGLAGNAIEGRKPGDMIIGIGSTRCNTYHEFKFTGSRIEIKKQAVLRAFELLLEELDRCGCE